LNDKATKAQGWLSFVICLFLARAVWVVFGQTRHHEFITYDDRLCIYDNPAITQGVRACLNKGIETLRGRLGILPSGGFHTAPPKGGLPTGF
jgi:hypothetical protein